MKTTFSRQYALIAGLLLVCMLVTGVSFWFLMRSYVEDEKEQTLLADADAVANLARAYNSAGELEDNWGFLMSLSFISRIGDAEALICDENGRVLLCSCEQFTCGHIGQHLDVEFCDQVREGGRAFQSGILQNIYASEKRYVAGSTIVSDSTDELIGFVVVSAPMRQVSSFMSRSTRRRMRSSASASTKILMSKRLRRRSSWKIRMPSTMMTWLGSMIFVRLERVWRVKS